MTSDHCGRKITVYQYVRGTSGFCGQACIDEWNAIHDKMEAERYINPSTMIFVPADKSYYDGKKRQRVIDRECCSPESIVSIFANKKHKKYSSEFMGRESGA